MWEEKECKITACEYTQFLRNNADRNSCSIYFIQQVLASEKFQINVIISIIENQAKVFIYKIDAKISVWKNLWFTFWNQVSDYYKIEHEKEV
jgi:hypothetical protein